MSRPVLGPAAQAEYAESTFYLDLGPFGMGVIGCVFGCHEWVLSRDPAWDDLSLVLLRRFLRKRVAYPQAADARERRAPERPAA